MLRIERIAASQGALLQKLRCRALGDAPHAFSGTIEEAKERPREAWSAWAKSCSENSKAMFIAYYNEKPCGMMGCDLVGEGNEVGKLLAVWVAPEYRRLKVGQGLLEVVKQWASENHARVLHIWVAEQNAPAISFYKAAGCEVTGQRESLRSDATQQEILLILKLNDSD